MIMKHKEIKWNTLENFWAEEYEEDYGHFFNVFYEQITPKMPIYNTFHNKCFSTA